MNFAEKFFKRSGESWAGIKAEEFLGFISSKCQSVLTIERLKELLYGGRSLKVKFGIDPTASNIHMGHVVPIMLLRQFQKAGHQIDFIIGDFTAKIGDPSGRNSARPPITAEQIMLNMATYKDQVKRFIDVDSMNIRYNSEWLGSMSLFEIFEMFQAINLAEAVQRNDFRERLSNHQAVSLAEVCYGSLMGIDSVRLGSDIEIGGIDQLLNFQQCRQIMQFKRMVEEVILMTPILEGVSGNGRKMSKSFGNTIAVNDSPEDKFGKVMSIPDKLITSYFLCFADTAKGEKEDLEKFVAGNPLEAKKQLAVFIVSLDAGNMENGLVQRELFERKFSKKEIAIEDCLVLAMKKGETFFEALWSSGQFSSRSELRRLFEQKAIRVMEAGECRSALCINDSAEISCLIKVGKRKFFNVQVS